MDDTKFFNMKEMKEENNEQVEGSDGNLNASRIFDNLSAGLLTSLHLVQASVDELLSLKDELLKQQALPPVVLSKVAVCTTKVFRSVSDCWVPANELTRLTKLYSTPWEEKGRAYKRLYDNFESKKSQLNIAIRRLKLLEARSCRMERENRVKNWEKMFLKIMSAKGHNRRWKFLTAWFKSKVREGPRAVQQFVRQMANAADSEAEEEEQEEVEYDHRSMQKILPREPLCIEDREIDLKDMEKGEAFDNVDDREDGDFDEDDEEWRKRQTSASKVDVIRPLSVRSQPKQVTMDRETWTHEPEFDGYLCIRVFRPEELGQQEFVCRIQFGDQNITTEFRHRNFVSLGGSVSHTTSVRGRGLIGRRSDTAAVGSGDAVALETKQSSYEDSVFCLPEEDLRGTCFMNAQLNFEVYSSRNDRLLATAVVDMDDLATMDLPTLLIPPPEADDDPLSLSSAENKQFTSTPSMPNTLKHAPGKTIPHMELNDRLASIQSTSFPLFTVGSESGNRDVCGRLPLICTWAKQEKPRTFNRVTESENLNEIVYDLTGFDLTLVTKEDLHKETEDRATSPVTDDSNEVPREVVPRLEYEKVLRGHVEEMEIMRNEYDARLREMADSLQEMEEAHSDMQRLIQTNTESSLTPGSDVRSGQRSLMYPEKRSKSQSKLDVLSQEQYFPQPPKDFKSPRQATMFFGPRLTRSATTVSEDIPHNFYDRLKHFKDKSQKRKQELSERMKQEESEIIEKRLAGNYKLSAESPNTNSLQDVNLPAVFMPTKNRDLNIYNPRAHQYFHATGAHGLRLTQPPSILELPPISNSTIPIINLFEVSQNFQQTSDSGSWLIQHLNQQPNSNPMKTNTSGDQVVLEMEPVLQKKDDMSQHSVHLGEAAVE